MEQAVLETPFTAIPVGEAPPVTTQAASESSAVRPRDDSGRFVPSPSEGPPPPPPTKFSPQLVELAKTVYYTDDQINSFADGGLLYEAVIGRMASMPRQNEPREQPPAQAPQNVLPPPASAFPEFALNLSEDIDPATAAPLKEIVAQFNQMRAVFEKSLAEKDSKIDQLANFASQSAASTRETTKQQQAAFWDRIVESVPGLVETVGLPSQAMIRPGSAESAEWSKVATMIHANATIQGVPAHLIDYERATRDGWLAYQAIGGKGKGNGQGNGIKSLPGVAPRGVPRSSISGASTSPAEDPAGDYEARLAAMKQAWAASGGRNPFL